MVGGAEAPDTPTPMGVSCSRYAIRAKAQARVQKRRSDAYESMLT
jgi:hypothetical protein